MTHSLLALPCGPALRYRNKSAINSSALAASSNQYSRNSGAISVVMTARYQFMPQRPSVPVGQKKLCPISKPGPKLALSERMMVFNRLIRETMTSITAASTPAAARKLPNAGRSNAGRSSTKANRRRKA